MTSNTSTVQVVVGGQFGSEGKGAVVAHLASQHPEGGWMDEPRAVVRVAGPNAGHTVIDSTGRAWPLRTVPVGAVADPGSFLVIAAGSEIEWEVLEAELRDLDAAGFRASERIQIDGQATVLSQIHHDLESARDMHRRIGSTGKGIGAARAARIMREANLVKDEDNSLRVTDTGNLLHNILINKGRVIIEGTQGYGLGLHAGHYPQCTSSDTRAIDFLAMAGISPWAPYIDRFEVYVTARVYPIRVAGNSGPLKNETTWEELGLPVELTTVTHKPRRVGHWDSELLAAAVRANGGAPAVRIALTMVDQRWPEVKGLTGQIDWSGFVLPDSLRAFIQQIEDDCGAPVTLLGTGPATMVQVTG